MKIEDTPLCGADLERWRVGLGLSKVVAADAFGMNLARWEELVSRDGLLQSIDDPVVAMLLQFYVEFPETAPIPRTVDVREFYDFLGLQDNPKDKETFAVLIGRSPPSVYRLLGHEGKPGRPIVRWIQAVRKLGLSSKATLGIMRKIAGRVGLRQQAGDVVADGWRRSRVKDSDD